MALPNWPAGVPGNDGGVQRAGYEYTPPNNVIVSEQEVGQKRRRRATVAWAKRKGAVRMTAAEFDLFLPWVRDDLKSGMLRFNWIPPEGGAAAASRFTINDGRAYSVTPLAAGRKLIKFEIESLE